VGKMNIPVSDFDDFDLFTENIFLSKLNDKQQNELIKHGIASLYTNSKSHRYLFWHKIIDQRSPLSGQ